MESMKHCLSTAHGVHYISESVYGLHVDCRKYSHGLHGLHTECSWSAHGVLMESMSTPCRVHMSAHGVHGNVWGSVKYSLSIELRTLSDELIQLSIDLWTVSGELIQS